MERFTNPELAGIHLSYGLAEEIAIEEERLYQERYPQRREGGPQVTRNFQHGTRIPSNGNQHILFHVWSKMFGIPWSVGMIDQPSLRLLLPRNHPSHNL
ncbi:hypothetical protein TNCV_276911 [Trichonephila clavipes]|uniref:Uncharacterized protein n=1 Tax=Trichonephila clavipes TaxID=2585209 RepID=A0A8X6VC43_TRICX|nr:hypothetical protein TNCV_276911 [Trichonephila clavipes]